MAEDVVDIDAARSRLRGTPAHLYDCQEVADYLGVSIQWVRRKVQERKVPFVRLGRSVRFSEDHLQELVAQFTVQPIRAGGRRSRL